MRRIPVVAVIREAYIFLATHLGGIIGLIWVPMVLLTLAEFFTLNRLYNDSIEALASGDGSHLGPALLMALACVAAALLLYAMMLVAALQVALGTRSTPSLVHFAFGAPEWRTFRALFSFVGLAVLVGMSILVAANALFTFLPGGKIDQTGMGNMAMLAMMFAAMILAARFLLLLPAIAVNESGPVLRRAWALSGGNFLPLFGILLAVVLPVKFFQLLVEWKLFPLLNGFGLGGKSEVVAGATPQLQLVAILVDARQMLPLACGLGFLISPILIGLLASASLSVWRALKDEPVVDIAV